MRPFSFAPASLASDRSGPSSPLVACSPQSCPSGLPRGVTGPIQSDAGGRGALSHDKNAIPNNANGSLLCYTISLGATYDGFLRVSASVAQIIGACPQNLSEISVTVFCMAGQVSSGFRVNYNPDYTLNYTKTRRELPQTGHCNRCNQLFIYRER